MRSQDSILACARQGGNAICCLRVCSTLVLRCARCFQALEGPILLRKQRIARSLVCRVFRAFRLARSAKRLAVAKRANSLDDGHKPTGQAHLSLPAFGAIIPSRRGSQA